MEQENFAKDVADDKTDKAPTLNIDELLDGANTPSWQIFEAAPRENRPVASAGDLGGEWPAPPANLTEKAVPQLDSAAPNIEDFVERLSTVSWSGFAAKPRETRAYPSLEELPLRPSAPSPEPEEPDQTETPEMHDPTVVLPDWVVDITPESLPKRRGYLIYRDQEDYVCVATCSKWSRQAYAALVDNYLFMILTLYFAAFILAINVVNRSTNFLINSWWAISGLWVAIYFTYNFTWIVLGGQTFGKERLNVRVAKADGRKPPVWSAFIRSFYTSFLIYWCALFYLFPPYLVVTVVVLLLSGFSTTFLDPYRRTLPDVLAATYVINTDDLMTEGSAF